MNNMPAHLFPFPPFHTEVFNTPQKRAAAAKLPDQVRKDMIWHLLFPYDQFKAVTAELKAFHHTKGLVNKGKIFGVIGEYRTGKSYIVQSYLRPYRFLEGPHGIEYPTLYLQASDDWGADGFQRAVISATGGGIRGNKTFDFSEAAINRMIDHNVGAVFIEDIQMFLDKPASLFGFMGFVHKLLSMQLCAIFLITTKVGDAAIRKNTEIKERGGYEIVPVKGFNANSAKGKAGMRLFLAGVDEGLPFKEPSNLGSVLYANTFRSLSMTTVPKIMNVVRSAALRAFEDDAPHVTQAHIEGAIRRQLDAEQKFDGLPGGVIVNADEEESMYV